MPSCPVYSVSIKRGNVSLLRTQSRGRTPVKLCLFCMIREYSTANGKSSGNGGLHFPMELILVFMMAHVGNEKIVKLHQNCLERGSLPTCSSGSESGIRYGPLREYGLGEAEIVRVRRVVLFRMRQLLDSSMAGERSILHLMVVIR